MRYFGCTFIFLLLKALSSAWLVEFVLLQVKTLAGLFRITAAVKLLGQKEIKRSRAECFVKEKVLTPPSPKKKELVAEYLFSRYYSVRSHWRWRPILSYTGIFLRGISTFKLL